MACGACGRISDGICICMVYVEKEGSVSICGQGKEVLIAGYRIRKYMKNRTLKGSCGTDRDFIVSVSASAPYVFLLQIIIFLEFSGMRNLRNLQAFCTFAFQPYLNQAFREYPSCSQVFMVSLQGI